MHERNLFERRDIDIIVPVYKSVELTTRCLDSLAQHIDELADRDPRLIVINDSPIACKTRQRRHFTRRGYGDVRRDSEKYSCRRLPRPCDIDGKRGLIDLVRAIVAGTISCKIHLGRPSINFPRRRRMRQR
jgi:hypothetical protein